MLSSRVLAALDLTAELSELEDRLNTDADLQARVEAAIRQELGIDPKLTDSLPVPTHPSADLFKAPAEELGRGQHITVGPAGEIVGRFWTEGHCIIETGALEPGMEDCWSPPRDVAEYGYFHQSDLTVSVPDTAETEDYKVGLLVPGHSHPAASIQASQAHYNDPTNARAAVRAYDDLQGGIVVGSMLPGSTYADALLVKASALSGHWERLNRVVLPDGRIAVGEWACLGPCLVGGPGLPLERGYSMTASAGTRMLGNSSPPHTDEETPPAGDSPTDGLGSILDRITHLESKMAAQAGTNEQLDTLATDLDAFKAVYYQGLKVSAPDLDKPEDDVTDE